MAHGSSSTFTAPVRPGSFSASIACLATSLTDSTPNPFDPSTRSSLKYSGVHSNRFGGSTPDTTSVPPVESSRSDVSTVSTDPIVSYTTQGPSCSHSCPLHGTNGDAPTRRATSATSTFGTEDSTACAPSREASRARAPGLVAAHTSAPGYMNRTSAITAYASVPEP